MVIVEMTTCCRICCNSIVVRPPTTSHTKNRAYETCLQGYGLSRLLTYYLASHNSNHQSLHILHSVFSMAIHQSIVETSQKHPKPSGRAFQYGTAGVSPRMLDPELNRPTHPS